MKTSTSTDQLSEQILCHLQSMSYLFYINCISLFIINVNNMCVGMSVVTSPDKRTFYIYIVYFHRPAKFLACIWLFLEQ
jgi:hypothetical protein